MNNSEIYDIIYTKNINYNYEMPEKYKFIDNFIYSHNYNTIVDVGCGAGNFLKRYLELGKDVIGIEISKVCCEKYLQGLPL